MKEAILYIGVCQAIFAASILATKRKVYTSDVILILSLLAIGIRFFAKIITEGEGHSDLTVGIIPLTLAPILYLYSKYLTRQEPGFDKKDLWHFAPFFIFMVVYPTIFAVNISFNEETFLVKDQFIGSRIVFALIFYTTIVVYTVLSYQQVFRYIKEAKNDPNRYDLYTGKLIGLLCIVALFNLIFISYLFIGLINMLSFSSQFDLVLISNFGLAAMTYAISYFGIHQPSIFEDFAFSLIMKGKLKHWNHQQPRMANGSKFNTTEILEKAPGLDNELSVKLKNYMETSKPYLDPELSLAKLSDSLNISKTQLTDLLNNDLNLNFFSFVNNYRIQEVKEKLNNPSNSHYTILSIAFDCGFNSKSTFNSIFKQATGLTPSGYRNNQLVTSE